MEGEASKKDGASGETAAAKEKAAKYVGQVVAARYLIQDIIALGGMGAVFRAEHVHMRKRVALKLLHPWSQNLPELVARFERESIVGSHVTHPNVCSATDFGRIDDGSHYLVLEYVEGRTLLSLLKEGPVPPAQAAEIVRQIAAGLGAAHELGIYHRDVKPSNIMLLEGPRVQVKIVDFGLAKLPAALFHADEQVNVTATGTVFGTVAYMAPELARGMQAVDHRSDLYALGIIFFEMLAGQHPFEETAPSALFRHHRFTPPPKIADRSPGVSVPPALEAIVRRLIEKEPEARFESADDLIDALDEASPPEHVPAPRTSSRGAPTSGRPGPTSTRKSVEAPDPSDASQSPSASSVHSAKAPSAPASRGVPGWVLGIAAIGIAGAAARYFAPGLFGVESANPSASSSAPASSARPSQSAAPAMTAEPASSAIAAPPVTSATAAIAPSPSTSAVATPEVTRMRGVLAEAATARDATRGAQAMIALAKAAPSAFRDRDVVANAAAIAVSVELGDRAMADDVFGLLGSEALGDAGPDVLFHVTSFYGGSRGAARAAALLAKPEVLARASPAMRIARDLKSAACKDRAALLDRASTEGDQRALAILAPMVAVACPDTEGACCAPFDPRFTAAVAALRERLRK